MCEASAALLPATAPALLASTEPAVSCPAALAATENSAEKGEGGRELQAGGGKKEDRCVEGSLSGDLQNAYKAGVKEKKKKPNVSTSTHAYFSQPH